MKMTVSAWTNVQFYLPDDSTESWILNQLIERRTFGKRWGQEIAIGLTKSGEAMVNDALAREKADDTCWEGLSDATMVLHGISTREAWDREWQGKKNPCEVYGLEP